MKVKEGSAVIGTDAFCTYKDAKAAGDVVLCDVFSNSAWADTIESTVDVEIEGDTHTLTIGENAFATLEAAAFQVATNQYGGVETYGESMDAGSSLAYVSSEWADLPDYAVVTMAGSDCDKNGGGVVIGVNAFASYEAANANFAHSNGSAIYFVAGGTLCDSGNHTAVQCPLAKSLQSIPTI